MTLLLWFGCSGSEAGIQTESAPSDPTTSATSTEDADTAGPTPGESDVADPVWLALDANFVVIGGVPDATSTLTWTLLDAAAEGTCSESVTVVAATSVLPPDGDIAAYAWWTVTLSEPSLCGVVLPTELSIGIGPWNAALQPAADHAGLEDVALYGLFLSVVAPDAWIIGAAGTNAQFTGGAPLVSAPPLPDDTYSLASLVLLPWFDLVP